MNVDYFGFIYPFKKYLARILIELYINQQKHEKNSHRIDAPTWDRYFC